jgi:hypothetical protein
VTHASVGISLLTMTAMGLAGYATFTSSVQGIYSFILLLPRDHRYLREVDWSRHISLQKNQTLQNKSLVAGTSKAGGLGQAGGLTKQMSW